MYDGNVLRRKIGKEGIDRVIFYLASDNFSNVLKEKLNQSNIFMDGYLTLSLLYSLK